jgi:hypothetical protein
MGLGIKHTKGKIKQQERKNKATDNTIWVVVSGMLY